MADRPTRTKPVIGLLGAPGSGKSSVAGDFASLGCGVIDADKIARAVLDEPEVASALRAWWGERVFAEDGRVNRAAVGEVVFDDATQLRRLESVVHPRVAAERDRRRGAYLADPAVVAVVEDVPLLLEKGLEGVCDVLVYVEAPRAVRLARLSATRGWDAAELDRREKNQWPLDSKRERAEYVIDNAAGEADRADQCRRVLDQILQDKPAFREP